MYSMSHIEVTQTKHPTQSSTTGKEQLFVAIFGLTLAECAVNCPLPDSAQLTVHGKYLYNLFKATLAKSLNNLGLILIPNR